MNPVRRFSAAVREMRWAQVVLELGLLIAGILIAPRRTSNLPVLDEAQKDLAARVGVPIAVTDDRLWGLPVEAPEWAVLRTRLWMRTFVSFQAIRQAAIVAGQIRDVRESLAAELARRWPDARPSAPAR